MLHLGWTRRRDQPSRNLVLVALREQIDRVHARGDTDDRHHAPTARARAVRLRSVEQAARQRLARVRHGEVGTIQHDDRGKRQHHNH